MEAKKLGEILFEEGMITGEQLEKAVAEQLKTSEPFGSVLVKLGFITEDVLYHFLAMQVGTKFIDVSVLHIEEEVVKLITPEVARKYK
ncbi:MAG TPA: type II secretion system protein GspE, partial [bacterium]|nr:type II secretion system protein GspE [bacterium]